jgi:membrane protein
MDSAGRSDLSPRGTIPTPPTASRPAVAESPGARPNPDAPFTVGGLSPDALAPATAQSVPESSSSTAPPADARRVARLVNTEPWHPNGSGPVPTADGPVRKRWRKVALRTLSKSWNDSLFGMSSQAAFWSAMSTAPLLLALLGLSGYVARLIGPDTITDIRTQVQIFLNTIFNEEVADNLLGNTVDVILNNNQADVVSIGLLISLWAGSSAMTAFVESINIAYCQHEFRHPVLERFFALGLYVGALAAGILVVPLLAIGPDYLPRLFPADYRSTVSEIIGWVYYPGLAIGLILLLTTLYKVAPKHKHRWMRGLPGAFLAAAVFLVASTGLRLYLSYVYANGLTYGALATPITFLLFYYFISMAIIIGAQFNNALLEYYPPRISGKERKQRAEQSQSSDLAPAPAVAA